MATPQSYTLVVCPYTERGFAYSMDQTMNGHPEFLFLDTPVIPLLACGGTKIGCDIVNRNEYPSNLEVIRKSPFGNSVSDDGAEPYPELCFVARVLGPDNPLIDILEDHYLLQAPTLEHGVIVMIPIMEGSVAGYWGTCGIPVPTEHSDETLDDWIESVHILSQFQQSFLPRGCTCHLFGGSGSCCDSQ